MSDFSSYLQFLFLAVVLLFLTIVLAAMVRLVPWRTMNSTVCLFFHISKSTTLVESKCQASNAPGVYPPSTPWFFEISTVSWGEAQWMSTCYTNYEDVSSDPQAWRAGGHHLFAIPYPLMQDERQRQRFPRIKVSSHCGNTSSLSRLTFTYQEGK